MAIVQTGSPCPAEPAEVADAMANGLQTEETGQFATHVQTCDSCAATLRETKLFIDAIRAAAKLHRAEQRKIALASLMYPAV